MEYITKLESNNPDDVQFARQRFHDLFGTGEIVFQTIVAKKFLSSVSQYYFLQNYKMLMINY